MSSIVVVVVPKGRKDHIAKKFSDGEIITVCGKKVPEGSTLIESAPKIDLCKKCAEWVGREMIGELLGTDFFEAYKTSILPSVYKHTNRKGS